MDQLDWNLIRVLHETHSMTKAAEVLYISSPAVLYRVRRMEKEYGTPLFSKSNKGVSLTSAGLRLLSFADLMLQYDSYIYSQVNSKGEKISGTIEIGATSNFFMHELAAQIKDFHTKYPGIMIRITIDSSIQLIHKLAASQLMLAITRGKPQWNGPVETIFTEPHIIVSAYPINDALLHTMPYLTNDSPTSTPFNSWLEEYFEKDLPKRSKIQLSGDSLTLKALVMQGLGWAIIPYTHLYKEDGLYSKPLLHKDGTPYQLQTNLLYAEACKDFDTYQAYISHLREFFS